MQKAFNIIEKNKIYEIIEKIFVTVYFYSQIISDVEDEYERKKILYIKDKRLYEEETNSQVKRMLKGKLILKKQELKLVKDRMTSVLDNLMNSIDNTNKHLRKHVKRLSEKIQKRMS